MRPARRILVAGLGNVFFGDDAFGVAVAQDLLARGIDREGATRVVVRDVGLRGLHLAYELLEGWDLLIAIDAMPNRGAPGTLHLVAPGSNDVVSGGRLHEEHGMDLQAVLDTARALGASLPIVRLVACEITAIKKEMGMSAIVMRSVPQASRLVESLIQNHAAVEKRPGARPLRVAEGA